MKGEKLIAVLLTALTVLSPLATAAVSLGNYPTFLFKNHNLDAYVVVGADAKPADVVGAVDLAVRLAGESYTLVSATGGSSVAGGTTQDITLGNPIAGGTGLDTTLKKYKVSGLQSSSLSFADDTFTYHDEIRLSSTANYLDVETSLTKNIEEKYASDVYLEAEKKAIGYYFVFDKSVQVNKSTSDSPLELTFLGKDLTIESVSDAATFTVRVGDQYTLSVDGTVKVLGKTVTLKNVFSSQSVLVDVDGVTATISKGSTKTVNGIKVKPIDSAYSDTKTERVAVLLIGSETTKSYTNNDPYIGENTDNPNWIWNLAGLTTSGSPTIGIQNNFVHKGYTQTPIKVGGCYNFPNDYAKVCLDSLTVTDTQDYTFRVDSSIDLSNVAGSPSSAKVLVITAGDKEALQTTNGSTRTGTIYLLADKTNNKIAVYYIDVSSKVQWAGNLSLGAGTVYANISSVNYKDTKGDDMLVQVAGNITLNDTVWMKVPNSVVASDDLVMYWTLSGGAFDHLGTTTAKSEDVELAWAGTTIGTRQYELRTRYGTIVRTPDSNGASDRVVLGIPADQVKARVFVYGPGASSSTTPSGSIEQVVPISTAVAKLDTEVDPATVGKTGLVLVGGPGVNRLTAQAMGLTYPTYGSSGKLPFASGEGYIAVFDGVFTSGQTVIVVAGWEADQTRMATSLLQQFDTFASELGNNTAVKVTSLTSSGITPV